MLPRPRTVLFGACDRHNLGDLLFPHVVSALLGETAPLVAGLKRADLRAQDGHRVLAVDELARMLGDAPVNLIHVGGETLSCEAWDAAALLLAPSRAEAAYTRLARSGVALRRQWAAAQLKRDTAAPYVLGRTHFAGTRRVIHNAVGGVSFALREETFHAEVITHLREADFVGVRDAATHAALAAVGVVAALMPDCVVMLRELFGTRIAARAEHGECAAVRKRFARGYLAAQFSADFADDASLDTLAGTLDHAARSTGLGVVLFRAGAAPLHDSAAVQARLAARMRAPVARFASIRIWDLAALIAASSGFVGSSLHGRLIALAYGLPRVTVLAPALVNRPNKHAAFVSTWDDAAHRSVVPCAELGAALLAALAQGPEPHCASAARLTAAYRAQFARWQALL